MTFPKLLATALVCLTFASAAEQPLTLESYCEITKRLYGLSELELKDRIAAAEGLRGDKKKVMDRFDKIRTGYQGHRNKLYSNFETNSSAFAKFAGDHRESIEQYLEENPSLQGEINSLKDRIQGLADRVEALLGGGK